MNLVLILDFGLKACEQPYSHGAVPVAITDRQAVAAYSEWANFAVLFKL